jgi:hypothetical protein
MVPLLLLIVKRLARPKTQASGRARWRLTADDASARGAARSSFTTPGLERSELSLGLDLCHENYHRGPDANC